jgi:hypothetical protein
VGLPEQEVAPAVRQQRRAAAACGGRGNQLGRTTGRRGVLEEGEQREARAVGELGDDAWSGAGAVVGLGRRSNGSEWRRCRAAEEAEEEEEGGVPGTEL